MTTYSISAPDGKTYNIDGPEGASQQDVEAEVMRQYPHLAGATGQEGSLSPEQIAAHQKKAMVSFAHGEHKNAADTTDLFAGLARLPRAVVNRLSPGAANALWPMEGVDPSSASYTIGSLADPAAMTLGMAGYNALANTPRLAAAAAAHPVMGRYLQSIAGGAGAGGAIGAAEGDITPAALVGAAASGVLHPLAAGLSHVRRIGANIAAGAEGQISNYLREIFGNDAPQVAASLRGLTPSLPGERVLPSMVEGVGSKRLGALEKNARSQTESGEALALIDEQNAAARRAAAQSRINKQTVNPGTPQQRTVNVPEEVRSRVTAPLYDLADRQVVPMDAQLAAIFSGPELQRLAGGVSTSLRQAAANANTLGQRTPTLGTPGRPAPITDFAVPWAVPQGPTPQHVSGEELKRLKLAIDSELKAARLGGQSPAGLDKIDIPQMEQASRLLRKWMTDNVPFYGKAASKFAQGSTLANETEWFSGLLDALNKPITAEGLSAFNTFVKNAPAMFTKKTGAPRYESPNEVINALSPRGQQVHNALTRSVEAQGRSQQNLGIPPGILPGNTNPIEQAVTTTSAPFSMVVWALRKASAIGGHAVDRQAEIILDRAMTNPTELAAMIESVPPSQRNTVMRAVFEGMRTPEFRAVLAAQMGGTANPDAQ